MVASGWIRFDIPKSPSLTRTGDIETTKMFYACVSIFPIRYDQGESLLIGIILQALDLGEPSLFDALF